MKYNNFAVLATSVLLVAWFVGVSPLAIAPNVIKVPEDYLQIQQAIDNANPGDVIQVASGTYFENLEIGKPLRLVGEGSSKTVIANTGTVVKVARTHNVEITGFSVQDGTYGIFLWYSQDILLENNEISNNTWNFGIWGSSLSHFVHDIDSSNTVDGKPMYFWLNQHGKQVPNDAGYVALINCTNMIAENMDLTSNEQGIFLVSTNNSVIENVSMTGNDEGLDMRMSHNNTIKKNQLLSINWRAVYLQDSNNNIFYENTVHNSTYALSIQGSTGNIFYHNNFVNNKDQVYLEASQTLWHNEEAQEGNYWTDYAGIDADDDGVGDTPHLIDENNRDSYPLMNPWDTLPPMAIAGQNETVNVNETVTLDASSSTDNLGIVSYEWDFGDGTTGTGMITTHVYVTLGVYTVKLIVQDAAGNSASDILSIHVESPSPYSWWMPIAGFSAGIGIIILAALVFRRYKSSRK